MVDESFDEEIELQTKISIWIPEEDKEETPFDIPEVDEDKIQDKDEFAVMEEIVDLLDHPWFARFYKEYLWDVIHWLEYQLISFDSTKPTISAERNKPLYSFNDLQRMFRSMLVAMVNEPIHAMKEVQTMCNDSNAKLIEIRIKWLTDLLKK